MSSARIPTHVRVLLLPLVTMISASAACSSTADPPASGEAPARQRSSALWNGNDDADTPVSNAVVALDGGCTGYAVTSQLVLTSAHCVVPSNQSDVGLVKVGQRVLVGANLALAKARVARPDAASPTQSQVKIVEVLSKVSYLNIDDSEDDLAVVRVYPPMHQFGDFANPWAIKIFPKRPALQVPDGGVSTLAVKIAGYGRTEIGVPATVRQSQVFSALSLDAHSEGYWTHTFGDSPYYGADKGDSGGPLLAFDPAHPEASELLGIHSSSSGTLGDGPTINYWTGPAWGGNAEFLTGAAKDPARPGKWKGETDYYGDCDLAHDPDCDGFYDVIPTTGKRGSDNCPGIYNPAQLPGPADDAGVVIAPSDSDKDGIPDYCDLEKEKPSTNADVDHNGLDDQYQPCPLFVPTEDMNGNGIPDCKDVCPGKEPSGAACAAKVPTGDADCDGICDEQDNCPGVANTDQANCNAVSENAHGAKALGDVCDPVPCPMFEPQVASPSPACTYDAYKWSCLTKSTLTGLSFSPIGSFGTGEAPGSAAFGGVEVPVTVPSTGVRYCVSRVGVACDANANVADKYAEPALPDESPATVYWRTSVNGDSRWVSGVTQRTYSATQPPEQVSWDYDADFAAWQASNYPVPLLGVVSGTTHTGRLWFHADTSVGMAGGPADVAAKTGIHTKTDGSAGEQLANHYSSVFPSQLRLEAGAVDGPWPPIKVDVCIGAECNAVPNTPIKDCIACNVLNPALVAPRPGDLQLVVDIPGLGLHGLTEAGGYAPIANPGAVSAELGALLALGGKQVTAVEPVRLVGRSTSVPQSLFLSTDGVRLLGGLTVLGDTVTTTQAARQLLLGGRRGGDAAGATLGAWTPASVPDAVEIADGAPAPAAGVAGIPVYSAALGQLLLVRSGGGAAGAGEVWRRDIRSPGGWQRVALGTIALGPVKAATYTYADGAMWVLDEVRGPFGLKQARLVRIGLEGEGAKVMASWPKLGVYDAHWLLVDRDGGLALVASSSKTLTHVAAKLDASGGGLHLSALRFAPGSLALPPVIDRNGFRFFVKRHKTDHLVETTRLASLAPATLSVSHVGGCF